MFYRSLLLFLCALPAFSGILVSVFAESGAYQANAEEENIVASQAGGRASATDTGVFTGANIYTGPSGCGFGLDCASVPVNSLAATHIRPSDAYLQSRARTNNGRAVATGGFDDTITLFGPTILDVYIDINGFSVGDSGTAEFFFAFGLVGEGGDDTGTLLVLIDAYGDVLGESYSVQAGHNLALIDSGDGVPGVLHYQFLLNNAFFGIPDMFPLFGQPLDVGFTLSSRATNDAIVSLDNSAYIGLQGNFSSANGYLYPGFDPGSSEVPEPSAAALVFAGLALLAARKARVQKRKIPCR